jgi:methionyl aminopeptidase
MPIILKSRREIEMMRKTGAVLHRVVELMRAACVVGATTREIDDIARAETERHGAVSMILNYPEYKPNTGFPGFTCVSINDEVVHGIPGPRRLKEGDIVKLDVAISLNGYVADTALTVPIGNVSPKVRKLLDVTRETLELAISNIKPDRRWSDIARMIQWNVERHGFSVVREFVGHGVGRSMHEDPKVPNFVTAEQLRGDFKLRPGTTIAVEPMVVMGDREVSMLPDGWTIVTKDQSLAAHYEHTIAVTETGCDILTDGSPSPVVTPTAIAMEAQRSA